MQNGLIPHPHMADKILEGYLKGKGSQPHTRSPQSRYPVPGREVTITSDYKNQWGLKLWKTKTAGQPGGSF